MFYRKYKIREKAVTAHIHTVSFIVDGLGNTAHMKTLFKYSYFVLIGLL